MSRFRDLLRGPALSFGLFLALSLLLTWPLGALPADRLPGGQDAFHMAWVLWWGHEALARFPWRFWDAPIYFPERGTLALGENLVGHQIVASPVLALTGSAASALAAATVVALAFTGWATCRWARQAGLGWPAAVAAGAIAAFAPARMAQLEHLRILGVGFTALALSATGSWFQGRKGAGALVGLWTALQFWCGIYVGLYGCLAALLYTAILAIAGRRLPPVERNAFPITATAGVAVVAGATWYLLLRPYAEAASRWGLVRTLAEVSAGSALPGGFLTGYPGSLLWSGLAAGPSRLENALFPGALALVLLAFTRKPAALALAACLGILALGPELGGGLPLPYLAVYHAFPGFDSLRYPGQIWLTALLPLGVAAGSGLQTLLDRHRGWLALLGLLALDLAGMPPTQAVPPLEPVHRALARVADGAAVEVPMRSKRLYADLDHSLLLPQTYHRVPLAGGYSGYYPPAFAGTVAAVRRAPAPEALTYMARRGVRTWIVRPKRLTPAEQALWARPGRLLRLAWEGADARIYVYQNPGTMAY